MDVNAHPTTVRSDLDLLTPDELAAALGHKGTTTLEVWRSEGIGPDYAKLGKAVFYRKADVRIWINKNLQKPTPRT